MSTLDDRKSIRKYLETDVDDILLRQLLRTAEQTQTMGNLQLYSVVVTRDHEMKTKLSPFHFNQSMVIDAPVVLTFCADYNRTTLWCENRHAKPGYNNFLSFMNAATDTLLYCQSFCNLAEEAGLGLCYLGTTVYNSQAIIDLLQLPQLVMPVATITLGWPAENPPVSDRLPLDSVIHNERYNDYSSALIDRFYEKKESLPENKKFVEINSKETLAQVFTDIRYTKKDCEEMSVGLLAALKNQGFL